MKKIIVLILATLFFIIGGCQKKTAVDADKKSTESHDFYTEMIKEDILSGTSNTNLLVSEDGQLTEPIEGASNLHAGENKVIGVQEPKIQKQLPIEPEVGTPIHEKQTKVVMKKEGVKQIQDEPIQIPGQQNEKMPASKSSVVKIGNDSIGQSVSPRKNIKMTFWAISKQKGIRAVDFSIYALPKGKALQLQYQYQIAAVRNVEMINGQAQLTRFWNGKNTDGEFLLPGNYNIYMVYTLRNAKKESVKKESRYWGSSEKYYIKLY